MGTRILALWLAAALAACGQAVLEPPLGMKWGDRPERILDWAGRHDLDVKIEMPAKKPHLRVIRLSPAAGLIPDAAARQVEARYEDGRLIEMTLHYGGEGTEAEAVENAFEMEKRRLSREHGKMTANQEEKSVSNHFSTVTHSYHREPVRGLFLLIAFTRIEDLLRKQSEAEYSVMYRNDNLRIRIENERQPAPASGR
ncbi:hypothetical protein [Haloferula sargassicola]|uniref:Lipoprotein n=1 Tax=Haloferula sargassicola TaxID=490096 RepID=A0ABP9UTI8_9BACT